ncbi:DUF7507 domain-containing protein [Chitinophaga sancti]|uniref:Gliding motility-associated C-terminal domain-containing protein n=1 Tax=Chitinophaga sancti TaxID=1004 RepID=A0A1K1SJY4_9BACT|nr:gliding motility-associated C-terminal domain-containing protein [Chitinophaga sancti]WQD65503.1 gliding motility-associated C-terminal domain-containing protein [Chitinophaga sancti]WQG88874.1 gliding motility-associated C-terminal domain-containing protein [Chitinophaga sancti]SFW84728.1 conserved repeat domain-containing protein/gliding motility-associated C-terminal domain-containing protein [Chitinophaga sancti]
MKRSILLLIFGCFFSGRPAPSTDVIPMNGLAKAEKAQRADVIAMDELVRAEEGGPNGIISFHLLNGSTAPSDITITYSVNATVTDPADNGVDYTTIPGTIVLKAGDTEVQLSINVIDDLLIEGDESIEIGLLTATDGSGTTYLGTQRTLTAKLIDNDNRLKLTKTTDGKELGNGNASPGQFQVSLPGTLTYHEDIHVKYTVDGASSATGGTGTTFDYNNANMTGEIILPANTNSILLPVNVNDDNIIESTETVQLTLQTVSLSSSGTMTFSPDPANISAIVNIEDDDVNTPIGILSTSNGKEPGGTGNDGNFTIGWPNGIYTTGFVLVRYTITGTATNGTDYTTITLTKTIAAGTSTVQIPVTVKDDNLIEGNETVTLTITGFSVGAGVPTLTTGTSVGTVNIADDDILSSKQWKSASYTGSKVTAGQQIDYTIHLRNTGNVVINNAKISDIIPAHTIFKSADDNLVPDASGKLSWTIPTIAVGTTITKNFSVTVANDLTGVTNITNTGNVDNGDGTGDHPTTPPDPNNPNEPHPNPDPNDPSTNVPVDDGGPKSSSWKSTEFADTAKPGDEITYLIHIRNTGHVSLTNVIVSDMIPAYTTFVDADEGIKPVSGKLTWTIPSIPVGAPDVIRSFIVRVVSDLTGATSITNTAAVDNKDGTGEHPTTPPDPTDHNQPHPNPDPNDPSTNIPVDNKPASLNWKSASYTGTGASGMVKTNDEITYTIHVRNTGNVTLNNVIITDIVPDYTVFGSADEGISPVNNKLTWTIATIPVGAADVTRSFKVKVAQDLTGAGFITNTADVDNGNGTGNHPTTPPDPNNPNEPKSNPDPNDPSTKVPVDNGKLSAIWKSAAYTPSGPKGGVTTGDEITYTIHIRNTGSITLTDVKITDTIPHYTDFISADEGIQPNDDKLSWTISNIPVGAPDVTRSFTVKVSTDLTGATFITNTAGVDNGNGKGNQPTTASDPNDPGNPAPNPPPGPATNISVDKLVNWVTWKVATTASKNEKVKPGEELTYQIFIRNTGNAAVENLVITDPVPQYTTFVSAGENGNYTESDGKVVWNVASIAVGGTTNVSMIVKTIDNLDSIPFISNTASVSDGTNTKSTAGCDPAVAGCSGDPGTITATTPGKSFLVFANAMSPNGDGKNDFFVIKGLEKYPPAALFVFNRWGDMVFQSKAYHNEWNGAGLSEGVYYYKLEVDEGEGVKQYSGWVILKIN